MLSLWRMQISTLTSADRATSVIDLLVARSKKGIIQAASIEPTETKPEKQTVPVKIPAPMRHSSGERARKIPSAVATPLPPRNPRKMEYWWPSRVARAIPDKRSSD